MSEPCYVWHFYHDGGIPCDFMCDRVSKNMEEAWEAAQQEGRRRNKTHGKHCQVITICVQYVTEARSGGVKEG